MQMSVAIELYGYDPVETPTRSGDLLGPNCLRGPLFSFAVKPLYIGHALRHGPPELYSYTALYSAIHYTAIHRYTLYNLYNTPLERRRRT